MVEREQETTSEIQSGRDPRTPFAVLGGTALGILALFLVAVAIAALAYVLGS